jgi:hypothetical protein
MIVILSGSWAAAYGIYCMIRLMFAVAVMLIAGTVRFIWNYPKAAAIIGAGLTATWLIIYASY